MTAYPSPAVKRVLVASSTVPHSKRGASAVVLQAYISALIAEKAEVAVLLLPAAGKPEESESLEYQRQGADGIKTIWVHAFPAPYSVRRGLVGGLEPGTLAASVLEEVKAFRADHYFCFDLFAAAVMNLPFAKPRSVWLGDLHFQTSWYHAFYRVKEKPISALKLPLAWRQSLQWKRLYRKALDGAHSVIVCGHSSVAQLARLGIPSRYLPYPWPSRPARPWSPVKPGEGKPTFLFLGNLVGLGSRSGFHFMCQMLYPELLRIWGKGGFRILICGMHELPAWIKEQVAGRPELEFLGFVEDLEDLMAGCHAVIVPIDVPVGNRTRIITAMAAGVPVIAHTNTALGNPDLRSGETCLLAATGKQFAAHMRKAAEDIGYCRRLTGNALSAYERSFSLPAATALLLQELDLR